MQKRKKTPIVNADTIVVIDFDHVLYDSSLHVRKMEEIFGGFGVTKEQARQAYARAGRPYRLARHLQEIKKLVAHFPSRQCAKEINALFTDRQFVYEDSVAFLKSVRPAKSVVFTYGSYSWQKEKVVGSGLHHFVDRVVVTEKEKAAAKIFSTKRDVIFIDDRGTVIDAIKRAYPHVYAVQIARPNGKYRKERSKLADVRLTSLRALRLLTS